MSKPIDYSKWDKIEVSDNEEEQEDNLFDLETKKRCLAFVEAMSLVFPVANVTESGVQHAQNENMKDALKMFKRGCAKGCVISMRDIVSSLLVKIPRTKTSIKSKKTFHYWFPSFMKGRCVVTIIVHFN